MGGIENHPDIDVIIQGKTYTKENTAWKRLCSEHARQIMICPCWIVEKNECEECNK